jgi:hypothetical protein
VLLACQVDVKAQGQFFFEKEPLNLHVTSKRSQFYVGKQPDPLSSNPRAHDTFSGFQAILLR